MRNNTSFCMFRKWHDDPVKDYYFQHAFAENDFPAGLKMPDSPDSGAKSQMIAPTSPNGMTPSLNTHKVTSIPTMNGSHSPHPPGSSGTPSPPTTMLPGGLSHPVTGTLGSTGTNHLELPQGSNGASKGRHVTKVKRFLATLQQFASEISLDAGERVHGLILGLVSSSLSIEEFHQKIQEVTNYPLRPFAVPFLKSHLPLLQTELLHFSRMAKQNPQQYLRQHEHLLLLDSSHHPPTEPFEIFQPDSKENNPKRRSPPSRNKDSDYLDTNGDGPPPAKKLQSIPSPTLLGTRSSPGALPQSHLPPGLGFRLEDPLHVYRDRFDRYDRFEREFCRPFYGTIPRDFTEERDMEEEWRNIHTMLNCILGMVEKTKRALAILQHRSYTEKAEFYGWIRSRHIDPDLDHKKVRPPADIVTHYKVAEDRVSEVRRRADAVNEVKRQAVAELQKAVSAAETKANELVATERAKMERLLSEARRQAAEDALAAVTHQEESTENCWNCGRKASETCSGCNVARYCGSFCQHKDWETHHRICGQTAAASSSLPGTSTTPPSVRAIINKSPSPVRTSTIVDIKPVVTSENGH